MKNQILKLLKKKDYTPLDPRGIAKALRLAARDQKRIAPVLRELAGAGTIARIKGNRYIIPSEADLIPGRIQMTRQGRGFLIPDDDQLDEIAIAASDTHTAFHEDRVLVRLEVGRGSGEKRGVVVRVLERRRQQIVGTLQRTRQFLYVIPDDPRIHSDIYVPEPRDLGRPVRKGDKVVVGEIEWESSHTNPEGEVVELLGAPTAEGVDMLSVLRQYELPLSFPRAVLQEVRKLGKSVSEADRTGRVDCRKHDVITIDPIDAKDFDDAFYLRRLSDGTWKLWVHIADVSHYVVPGSRLDREAEKRGNSTYLVDRVIPMLPEALSNELCSLKPKVDRLTKCVEFVLKDNGQVVRSRTYAAVIHSKRRFAYEEALEILEGSPKGPIETMLHHANRLAQRIRARRFRSGALELDFPEVEILLDEQGAVSQIRLSQSDIAHQLIEEFMLLANEAVAAKLKKRQRPTIYRIHEPPDERRLREYREEILSHGLPCGNLTKPKEVQKLLKRLNDEPMGKALKIGFLKSLMRARYATAPVGHYGLAKADYAHFTSPIRRYADLVVHRSLFGTRKQPDLKPVAEHISLTERNSADAERDSTNVKLYAHLQQQLETEEFETYQGLVIDIRNFGFFVDVSGLGMSGLVPLSLIKDEFFSYDTTRRHLRGQHSGETVALGDTVPVQVAKVDTFKKQVDFRWVRAERQSVKRGKGRGMGRRKTIRGGRRTKRRR